MDEISTGLDSSTTYLIVKCIRNFVHMAQGTVLMALLQPAPEVYNLFDDIMLLCEGEPPHHGLNFWPDTWLRSIDLICNLWGHFARLTLCNYIDEERVMLQPKNKTRL